jgi:NADH dehydrogenase
MSDRKKRVVVLGTGHAGFRAARRLLALREPGDNLEVVVVSAETSEVYHGLMPQIVGGQVQARHLLVPLRQFLKGVVFYRSEVEQIDLQNRKVILDPATEGPKVELAYDFLVIALGSVTDLSRFPGLEEHGLQTKTIGDIYHLHDHLLEMLERASVEADPAERRRFLTFLVAGAGYAGVEIGSEANRLLRTALPLFPTIRPEELSISIVTPTDRILPTMQKGLAASASRYLTRKGVQIRLKTSLVSASAGEAILSNSERVPTRSMIVTVGIAPNPVVQALRLDRDNGRIKVDEFLRVPGFPGVYAIGDNAAVPDHRTKQTCPATAIYAMTQGRHVAKNVLAELRAKPLRPYTFRNVSEVAQLSSTFGLMELFGVPISGFIASIMARTVFFYLVPSWRCRVGLLTDWFSTSAFPTDVSQMKIVRSETLVPMRFAAGQEIIRQGQPGSRFYIINSGRVEVVRQTDGQEEILATLGPGKYFGEIALLTDSMRNATVRALDDTSVLSIPRKDFKVLVGNLPVLQAALSEKARASTAG